MSFSFFFFPFSLGTGDYYANRKLVQYYIQRLSGLTRALAIATLAKVTEWRGNVQISQRQQVEGLFVWPTILNRQPGGSLLA